MSPRIVYSTDPDPIELCPRCGRDPCVCGSIDLPAHGQTAYVQRDRKRRKGKTVTVISGLQHTPATFKELLIRTKGRLRGWRHAQRWGAGDPGRPAGEGGREAAGSWATR